MRFVQTVLFSLRFMVFCGMAAFGLWLVRACAIGYWRDEGFQAGAFCLGSVLTALGISGLYWSWIELRLWLRVLKGDPEATAKIQLRYRNAVKWVWRVNGLMIFFGAVFMLFILAFCGDESVEIRLLVGVFVALVAVFALVKAIKAWQA